MKKVGVAVLGLGVVGGGTCKILIDRKSQIFYNIISMNYFRKNMYFKMLEKNFFWQRRNIWIKEVENLQIVKGEE